MYMKSDQYKSLLPCVIPNIGLKNNMWKETYIQRSFDAKRDLYGARHALIGLPLH